ncbi:hypothetical protein [Adhaeribacter terreus]|uniref:Outer membrane protein beta-barrel domain-containing protein n=1 Tax=Adhaeribacter terreus TaxID=529703 RepID=A0ABW0E855_9BACT
MKICLLFMSVFIASINIVVAQEEEPKLPQTLKGESWAALGVRSYQNTRIKDSYYQTAGLSFGVGHYFVNKIAIKANVIGQRYSGLTLVGPTIQEFDNKDLILFAGQIRYNFWHVPKFGDMFIQSGYNLGRFTNTDDLKVKRWEIIFLGYNRYSHNGKLKNFGMEMAFGLENDNLNQKTFLSGFVGFNYKFMKRKQTQLTE